jgi:hypothetical protein
VRQLELLQRIQESQSMRLGRRLVMLPLRQVDLLTTLLRRLVQQQGQPQQTLGSLRRSLAKRLLTLPTQLEARQLTSPMWLVRQLAILRQIADLAMLRQLAILRQMLVVPLPMPPLRQVDQPLTRLMRLAQQQERRQKMRVNLWRRLEKRLLMLPLQQVDRSLT